MKTWPGAPPVPLEALEDALLVVLDVEVWALDAELALVDAWVVEVVDAVPPAPPAPPPQAAPKARTKKLEETRTSRCMAAPKAVELSATCR
jgi:hypothetical protein